MKLLSFSFKKISIEKFKDVFEDLKINTNIDISDIGKAENEFLKSKEDFLVITFKHTINYDPDIAKLSFEGTLLASVEPKLAKEVLNSWKKKEIPSEFKLPIFNIIFRKTGIKAIQMEDEIGLPAHIPLPRLSSESKEVKEE